MTDTIQAVANYLRQLAEREPELVLDPAPTPPADEPDAGAPDAAESDSGNPQQLAELEAEALQCTHCTLSETRNSVVFGVGDPRAQLMFIGEAPGADEDRQGEPFVGRAGKLLNRILTAMKLTRDQVYIANILKCRPPGNRNPLPQETAACLPYLERQVELIEPRVIVALGLVAAVHLLKVSPTVSVKSLRGRIFDYHGTPLVVTYHPAALLRSPQFKAPTWEDMQTVLKLLSGELRWRAEDDRENLLL